MKSILVRAPNWIGDQILAYPFFYYLRKKYPDARIAVSCTEWVRDLQFRNLIDDVYSLPSVKGLSLIQKIRVLAEASKKLEVRGPWDLAITLPNSFSSAAVLFLTKAKIRCGYSVDARGFLLNQGIRWNADPSIHRADAYLGLLDSQLILERSGKEFWVNEKEVKAFDPLQSWPQVSPLEPPREKYYVLGTGATATSRKWPIEFFIELSKIVFKETGLKAVLVGGPAEKPDSIRFAQEELSYCIDYIGQGSLASLWKIFRRARFSVCNESGLAHFAALCGSPVQVVCGAADPRRTRPIGPGKVQVAVNPVDCWPCERNVCFQEGFKKIQCLKGISAIRVWEEIQVGLLTDAL